MRLHFAIVPILSSQPAETELNRFLASHRIATIDRHFIADGERSAWAICVTYLDTNSTPPSVKGRIDYRQILSPADFEVYARLRALRKEISEQEGVPPYTLFTNEQLATMVRRQVRNTDQLREIDGVGPARITKYGQRFLEALNDTESHQVPPENLFAQPPDEVL